MNTEPFIALTCQTSTLVLDCRNNYPAVLYWGSRLCADTTPEMLSQLAIREEAAGCAAQDSSISLLPTDGSAYLGQSGLNVHRQGCDWSPFPIIDTISYTENSPSDNKESVVITSKDSVNGITLLHYLSLDTTGILAISTEIVNDATTALTIDWCAAATVSVPAYINQMIHFEGRWAKEFQLQRIDRFRGTYLRENRAGRTSHSSFPGLVLLEKNTNESAGHAYGFHLGWSGNHRLCSEVLQDGRGHVQMGELLLPGEIILQPGERYHSPTLYCGYSNAGLSLLSQQFHHYVRRHLIQPAVQQKPRLVHYNTWEAMYFDHCPAKLQKLADSAAAIGVERFVLDDGWFRGRRSDDAGLGDWFVDTDVYPQGLTALIEHITTLGMEFGLWVEPEMVNPDSDLYRQHPDWVLKTSAPSVIARNQLVLNLTLPEVQDYLFACLDKLLNEYAIAYLKWDMNRDIHQPGDQQGRPVAHRQVHCLYALLSRLRAAHPHVEIESCASGGGRADYGILHYTDRIWPSDSNDPLDRLTIQKGFSLFFPSSLMGSHVGAEHGHITGRAYNLSLRAGVAVFGNMGLELNLQELNSLQMSELKNAITLHKKYRQLIHSGNLVRLDTDHWHHAFGIVSGDKKQAVFSYTLIDNHSSDLPGCYRFAQLDANALYQLTVVWPEYSITNAESIIQSIDKATFTGEALMTVGMQLPLLMPLHTLLIELNKIDR